MSRAPLRIAPPACPHSRSLTDCALAAILTVLVLALHLPHAAPAPLTTRLGTLWPYYLAYLATIFCVSTMASAALRPPVRIGVEPWG